ncbi:Retrovirus-related Pol polyprotein from transposon TNT 1-94 [Vitis vinifera]|uniref:Retrovirus-related Pol polyprotein from transposon TNT 1-94 n=1 Tax=Vitis vinifera TaxID=29760 RepID=A0A438C1R6_VITVI|nr:Retrovirus-related Pol polyprotein from transposon TNT 1-94 [Vitis vinifera]
MAEEAGKASGIEKFDGTDFAYWRMQIEDYLYGRKLHLPLLGTKPESMKAEEWALLDRQVLGVIRLTLSKSVAHNVVKEKTTTDLMKALSGMYEKPSANNKVHLMKKLFNLKMAENASVAQHLNEFNTITNQLSSVEIDFDDEIRALIVLASLPNSWEAMRMAVSNSTGKEKLKYNDIDLILAEEIRRRDAGETSGSGSALNLETRGRGHFKRQCKSPKKKNEDDSANAVTEEVQDALLLAVDSDFGKVYLADGSALDVVGLGDVRDIIAQWVCLVTGEVRHIPDLRRNLISVGQLDDEGHAILFVGGTWKVTKGARVLARGKKTGTLYMTSCPRDTIAVADASTDTSLWHRRLGHMSEKGMKMLLSKGKLPELKSIDFDMCESCILGKQKKVSFLKTGRTPKVEKLELVHTDLWGPSPVASLGGSRYYITFIDDSSRKVWVYFLKNKSDVFVTFKKWKAMVETETGLKVKCLRSDNGGEYIDGGFSEYCAAQGIRMEKTIPGTPQQNGVAERMNRTLNERARTYLINRGPSVPMEFRLPEEVWSGKEVDLSTPVAEVRRSSRNIRPPQRYSPVLNYLLLTDGGEPECYDEALQDENSSKWELAMKDEMDSLLGNQTWELTELPVGKKALHNKWVYRIKNEHDGSKRYKARLVVKGFQQKEGIDYTEIFSPVVKMSTIRLVLGMVAAENLHLEQLDVKTAFLHGDLEEDLYMIHQKGSDIEKINNLKKQLSKQFAMKDLGAAKQILGMRIIRDKANGTLKLSQSEYVKKVLSRFNMNEAKPVSTPLGSHFKLSKEQSPKTEEERDHMSKVPYASAIGSLMYAMVCTRPDIAHAVGVVSRFMSRPGKQHWEAVKWILRYLKGSLDTCLCFTGASLKLQGYVDADFAGDIDSRKSTTGFVFTLGGTAISWTSNLQKIVTLSTTEAEYVAATEAGKEMIWLHGFLDELDMLTKGVTIEKLKLCAASIGLLA